MLKRPITYTDFNGNEITEDFYFNLSKTDILLMDAKYEGGLEGTLKRIIEANDRDALFTEITNIILVSHGVRSEDGKRFIRNEETKKAFREHAAFDALFFEMVTDENKAAEFVMQIVPADIRDKFGDVQSNDAMALIKQRMSTEKQEFTLPPTPPTPPAL